MNFYAKARRVFRGFLCLARYLIFELPKGLDISLRNKVNGITLVGNNGYALTSKEALKNMLNGIPFENKSFLDIGSGKGGALIYALDLGCKNATGLECEKFLHDIAMKNISILKLNSKCTSFNLDARSFSDYAHYDILFMFNPFNEEIYEDVVNVFSRQILQERKFKEKYLICYGGANLDAVNKSGLFSLIREDTCPFRGNMFRVFKTVKNEE